MNNKKNSKRTVWFKTFFRAMLCTAAAIILIVIGYLTAGILSGGL